jgi:hypothetical protein
MAGQGQQVALGKNQPRDYPVFQDCPVADCSRKGHNGFPRKDHLLEHLRAYHHVPVPKRGASKRVAKAQYP